jgi:hypothetical protein
MGILAEEEVLFFGFEECEAKGIHECASHRVGLGWLLS